MLFPAPFDELSVRIVRLLSERGSLRAFQIDRAATLIHPIPFSPATLYRHLKGLTEAQVLVHYRGCYDLSPLWKESVWSLGNLLREAPRKRTVIGSSLKLGERRVFSASTLLQLDPIWNSLLVELSSLPEERRWVGCNSHWWHAIGASETERTLFEVLSRRVDLTFVVSLPTPLDERAAEDLSLEGVNVLFNKRTALKRDGYAVWASDSYVLEVNLPASITKAFNTFYRQCSFPSRIPESFRNIFRSRERFLLSVTRNAKRAREIRELLAA